MNFKVIDEHGRQLAMGRNLAQLRAELGGQAQQHFQKLARRARRWRRGAADAACRPPARAARQAAAVRAGRAEHRALRKPHDVELRRAARAAGDPPRRADAVRLSGAGRSRHALRRRSVRFARRSGADASRGLAAAVRAAVAEPIKYLEKNLPGLREMAMQFMALGTQEELRDQIIDTALDRACLQDPLPDDDASFHTRRDEGEGPPDAARAGDRAAGRRRFWPNTRRSRRSSRRRSRSRRRMPTCRRN